MGHQPQQVPVCVGHDVALAPLCFLAHVKAARPSALGCFDGLAVDNSSSRFRIASRQNTRCADKGVIDQVEQALIPQPVEMVLHGLEWRKALGPHCPLATGLCDVLDRIPDLPHIRFTRTTDLGPGTQERFDQSPLFVRAVTCLTQAASVIVGASDFSPGHGFLRVSQHR